MYTSCSYQTGFSIDCVYISEMVLRLLSVVVIDHQEVCVSAPNWRRDFSCAYTALCIYIRFFMSFLCAIVDWASTGRQRSAVRRHAEGRASCWQPAPMCGLSHRQTCMGNPRALYIHQADETRIAHTYRYIAVWFLESCYWTRWLVDGLMMLTCQGRRLTRIKLYY